MRFTKAHGLGNDFLLISADAAPADMASAAKRLCERHIGVGADGVIVHAPVAGGVSMRLWNADGGEAEISGNGLRCLAAHVVQLGSQPPHHVVHTTAGARSAFVERLSASRFRVTCDLGTPILGSGEIPMLLDPPKGRVVRQQVITGAGTLLVTATSLGNPHCAVFLDTPAPDELLLRVGPALEHHPLFPRRTNVEFVTVVSRSELRVRFWERGVGYTRASGTGSASALVAAVLEGRAERKARVVCDGGVLEVEWPESGPLRQTGEVELLFAGEWGLADRPE